MSATATVTVVGIKDALKELRDLDPEFRKEINKKAKDIAKPATDAIKAAYPQNYLSGMQRNWTNRGRQLAAYDRAKAQKGVTLKIDTSKRNQSAITIIQKDPWASIIDMAGKAGGQNPQGTRFVAALTALFGQPSRVMWPTYIKQDKAVEQNMTDLVADIMAAVSRKIVS